MKPPLGSIYSDLRREGWADGRTQSASQLVKEESERRRDEKGLK